MEDDPLRKLDQKLREALVDYWIETAIKRGFPQVESMKTALLDLLEKKP